MGASKSKEADDGKPKTYKRTVFMPVDTSHTSERSVRWAAKNFVRSDDRVMLTSFVADQTPFVGDDEAPPVEESELFQPDLKAKKLAETACDKYVQIMMKESGVHEENVSCNVKRFHPGPSLGVGPSLVQGAEEAKADTIIIGSRGLGAVSRSLLRPLGLGSASDFTVHNAAVPVVVVKPT